MPLAAFRRLILTGHLAWLLALALWLPGAQWAAATHALLHLHASVAVDAEPPEHLPDACDRCVVAAAVFGAAPQGTAAFPLLAPLPQTQAVSASAAPERAAAATPYQPRAPPLLHA